MPKHREDLLRQNYPKRIQRTTIPGKVNTTELAQVCSNPYIATDPASNLSSKCSHSCPAINYFIKVASMTDISVNTELVISSQTELPLNENWGIGRY